jgi:hypothetical protein
MERRLVNMIVRGFLLFVLSMVLVFGFWEHRNFYEVGLYNLLILGGLATFLVLMAFRLALTGELPHGRPTGELTFSLDEGDRVMRKAVDLAIRPAGGATLPRIGQTVRARYDTGREFGKLLILDGTRKFLSDVTDEEARSAGYHSADELRTAVASVWKGKPDDLVALLRLRPLGVRE